MKKYRAALVVSAVLVVLAIVFRARLVAWFTGDHGGSTSAASTVTAGGWQISATIEPDPPREKGNRMRVQLRDGSGAPADADVKVTYDMAAMGAMSEMKGTVAAKRLDAGSYDATFDLPMAGSWTMIVDATRGTTSASARYTLTVGTKGLTALGGTGGGAGSGEVAYYTCSMHPAVHANEPGKCPICSMTLTPVMRSDEASGVVQVDEARQKAIGMRTEKATKQALAIDIRAVGKLTYDESRLTDVVLKTDGFVSGLRVTATGQAVKKGDTLFLVYSPDLYAAQQDYILARSTRDALGGVGRGDELVRAAETKLTLLGLSQVQLAAVAKSGKPIEKLAFKAPASGYVIEKNVVEGAAIKAGDRVLRLAALDKVWVEADVFEADLARVAVGQNATIALSYVADRTFEGKITFVYPYLDPNARTGRVRIELANTGTELKPDMYANVTLHVAPTERLTIPTSAIMFTGPRRIVIVDLGGGRLAPREIKVGAQSGDRTEVVSGIAEGDAVVTTGNFLIAAESRIRSSGTFWKDTP